MVSTWHADTDGSSAPTVTTVSYDDRGLPLTVAEGGNVYATYVRNVAGKITSRTSPNSDRTYTYDMLGRVNCDYAVGGGGTQFLHWYQYHPTGDLASLYSEVSGMATRDYNYTYDRYHQLRTAVDDHGYNASFTYTSMGKLYTQNVTMPATGPAVLNRNVNTNFSIDADKQTPDRFVDAGSGQVIGYYNYDDRGNLVERIDADGTVHFGYDGNQNLRKAEVVGGSSELYYYGGAGTRNLAVRKNAAGSVDRVRLWLGATEVWYYANGALDKRWVHVNLGSPIARIENQSTVEYTHHNMLGSLTMSLDTNGVPTAGYQYGAFGEVIDSTGATATHLRRFNGKEHDQVSRLAYYGYRYYDKLALTWTQSDPLYRFAPDIAFDEPRRMNLYSFSANNPLRFVDPDGRDWFEKGVSIATGAGKWALNRVKDVAICKVCVTVKDSVSNLRETVHTGQALYNAVKDRDARKAITPLTIMAAAYFGGRIAGKLAGKAAGKLKKLLGRFRRSGQRAAGGTLSKSERKALQDVADRFDTTIDVVGSRAAGRGRGVGTNRPVGKGPGTKSDIDVRIDGEVDIATGGGLSDALKNIGEELLDVRPRLPGGSHPPVIPIKPKIR